MTATNPDNLTATTWKTAYLTVFNQLEAAQAENDKLRQELNEIVSALEQYDHWLPSMPEHLVRTIKAVLDVTDESWKP